MKPTSRFVGAVLGAPQITAVAVAFLTLFGIYSLIHMPRQEFPDFTVRQGLVVGVFPGADSKQVEEQLTHRVEEYLFGYEEVNKSKTVSYSSDGRMIIVLELNDNVRDANAFWAKLRHGLSELKMELPRQVVALVANNDFGNTSAILLAMVADSGSYRDMSDDMKTLESEIRTVPAVSRMKRSGEQQDEIRVYVDREKLAWYGIKPVTIFAMLQGESMVAGGGSVAQEGLDLLLHVPPSVKSEQEIADQIVLSTPQGTVVRVRDVARVVREPEKPDSYIRTDGVRALVLSIEMQPGNNIVEFGAQVNAAIERAQKKLPPGVKLVTLSNAPAFVNSSVQGFLKEFCIAIATVILVTMLLLPMRVASVAAVTIPVGVCITLGILHVMGMNLNTVTLAGLILVLGMIVDNAIVIVDDYADRIAKGEPPIIAAERSVTHLFTPVFTATLAIIMIFIPISFIVTGTMKDFIGPMAPTIAVALIVSLVLSVTLVPLMCQRIISPAGPHDSVKASRAPLSSVLLNRLQQGYDGTLVRVFNRPVVIIILVVALFIAAAVVAVTMPRKSFPAVERNQCAVEIYLPAGSALSRTDSVSREVETALLHDSRVRSVTAFIGTSSPRFHTLYAPNFPARNYAQLVVTTVSSEATLSLLDDFGKWFSDRPDDTHIRWKQLEMQRNSSPIEVRISGDDIAHLKSTAAKIKTLFGNVPGVVWVRNDYLEPRQGIEVQVDRERANELGISRSAIAAALAVATIGLPVATLWEGDHPVNVSVVSSSPGGDSAATLGEQPVLSSGQAFVPLRDVMRLVPDWTEGQIVRRNGVRTLTVAVDLDRHTVASVIVEKTRNRIAAIAASEGVSVGYGGEQETEGEVYLPLLMALIISIAVIFFILLVQFKQTRLALLIMVTMPLGFPGMVLGLKTMGYPFGATAFIGFSSLMGMVVRNGIIYINYAQQLIAGGASPREAALAAARRRMRPIVLTSAAAAMGVIPMILGRSTLWGPLGTVICFGLIISTVLTLFILPIAYYFLVRKRAIPTNNGSADNGPMAYGATVAVIVLALFFGMPRNCIAEEPLHLGLDTCLRLAERNNPDLRTAEYELRAAEQTREAAFTQWFPKMSAGAQGVVFHTPLLGMIDTLGVLSATVTQPIFAGGRILYGNRLAGLGKAVAIVKRDMTHRDVILRIAEKYRAMAGIDAKMQTLMEYGRLLEGLQKNVDHTVTTGLATRNDRLKVAVKRQETAVGMAALIDARRLAVTDLCLDLGVPEQKSVVLIDTIARPFEKDIPRDMTDDSLQNRGEAVLLEKAVEAERLQSAMKRGEVLPEVSVGAAVFRTVMPPQTSDNKAVFGTVSIPISSWWETAHALSACGERVRMAENARDAGKDRMRLQAGKERADMLNAFRRVILADSCMIQADVNLRDNETSYRSGLSTLTDVLDAQALWQESRSKAIDAAIDFWNHRAAYRAAQGLDR